MRAHSTAFLHTNQIVQTFLLLSRLLVKLTLERKCEVTMEISVLDFDLHSRVSLWRLFMMGDIFLCIFADVYRMELCAK